MITQKLKQQFTRPLVVGLVSVLAARAAGHKGSSADLPFGLQIPIEAMYGLVGAGSSLATETIHQWVLPYLPQSPQTVKLENAILSPLIHGALNYAVVSTFYPELVKDVGWKEPVMIGVGAEVIGGYSFDNYIKTTLLR